MREIKFRTWDEIIQTMTYMQTWEDIVSWKPEMYEETIVMQYTGLKDKNGKEVYEGDIVKIVDDDEYDSIIAWDPETGSFHCEGKDKVSKSTHIYGINLCEVIGNIYENPNLMEG